MKLTNKCVQQLEVTGKDSFTWCDRLPGFGCKVSAAGKKTYVVQFRIGGRAGKARRKKLGDVGLVTIVQARKRARELLSAAQLGQDLTTSLREE